MLAIAYAPENAALAERIQKDLVTKGCEFTSSLQPGLGNLLIVLISSAAKADSAVQAIIVQALDNGQHIVPIQVDNGSLPKLIDHLEPISFAGKYNLSELEHQIQKLSSPDAGLPLKVLTPKAQQKNRKFAYWLAVLAIIWFILGVILVGFFGVQAPREEYDNIDTEVAGTIQFYLSQNIPRTTEDAANFPVTVQAAPTAQRPYLIATATEMALSH
jgi:hypothetical protein